MPVVKINYDHSNASQVEKLFEIFKVYDLFRDVKCTKHIFYTEHLEEYVQLNNVVYLNKTYDDIVPEVKEILENSFVYTYYRSIKNIK